MTEPPNPPAEPGDSIWHYSGGEWMQLPWTFTDEQTLAIRAVVQEELRRIGLATRIELTGAVEINGETIGKLVFPHISKQIDDDLSAGLAGLVTPS